MSAVGALLELAIRAFDAVLARASAKDRAEVERRAEVRLRKRREFRERAQARNDAVRAKGKKP